MSIQSRSFAFVTFSVLALGCGSEDPKAQDKCETLVTSYCDRVVSCAERAGILGAGYTADDLQDECELAVSADAHCEDATEVTSSYGQCIDDAKSQSCDDVTDALTSNTDVPLPTSCRGVIRYPE